MKTSKSNVVKFPERLRQARMALGLTQQELAESVKVAQPDISSWEKGRGAPIIRQFVQLEAVLGPLAEATGPRDDGAAQEWSVGAFGAWLKRAREKSSLSVPALAKKAEVTPAAIYNLESGRSTNPQVSIRKRLEAALGKDTPDDVIDEAKREQAVEGLGSLIDFDPYSQDDLPVYGGVYVLYDISDRPIYVGQGQVIKKRILAHSKKPWFLPGIVHTAAYIQIEEVKLRRQVEEILIRFLKSNAIMNKQHVER